MHSKRVPFEATYTQENLFSRRNTLQLPFVNVDTQQKREREGEKETAWTVCLLLCVAKYVTVDEKQVAWCENWRESDALLYVATKTTMYIIVLHACVHVYYNVHS